MMKEEVKLPVFADGMIVCVENPKEFSKKLLELTSEFSKFAGYIGKSLVLSTSNEHLEMGEKATYNNIKSGQYLGYFSHYALFYFFHYALF